MAQKNSNYNYLKFSNVLAANNSSGALGVADDIAYDWTDTTTDPGGNPKFVMNKSVKEKIAELQQNIEQQQTPSADDIIYTGDESIKSAIDSLNDQMDSVSEDVHDATTAKNLAQAAAQNAQTYAANAENSANSLNDLREDVEEIKDIANTFATAFDADASFAIISEQEYQSLPSEDLVKNCIYFCYQ